MRKYRLKSRIKRWFFRKSLRRRIRTVSNILALLVLLFLLGSLTSSARESDLSKYLIVQRGTVVATAYNSLSWQTDDSPWITASGTRCREGVVAANFLPFGTKVMIEGFGDRVFVVEDRMNRRYNERIDIWMRNYRDALEFGKREVKFYVIDA